MKNSFDPLLGVIFTCLCLMAPISLPAQDSDSFLSWTSEQAERVGRNARVTGRAGGLFDTRIISTNNAINYNLRATLFSLEVIRASARKYQIENRLNDEQTKKLVQEAESAGDLVVMVEIDPNEGSGVIPLDWRVFLQPKGTRAGSGGIIPGVKSPLLRKNPAFAGVFKRNYEYDVFWVTFPLVDSEKKPLLPPDVQEIELVVGIYNKEGHVTWRVPDSIREKINHLKTQ